MPVPLGGFSAAVLFLWGLVATIQALELPFAWYQGYWLERRYGLSTQILPHWLADHVKAVTASSAVMVAGLVAVYLCIRLWPAGWWIAVGALFTVTMVLLARLAPVILLPIFYRVRPLRRDELSSRLVRLAERAGAPVIGAYEWAISGHTRKANAALAGIGRSRRILLSDTMLEAYSDDEIEVVLAHELAHHVHRDTWRALGVQAVLTIVTLGAVDRLLDVGGTAWGLSSRADPAGLPWLALVVLLLGLLAAPLANGFSRRIERQADDFALSLTADARAFVAAMERLAALNLAERRPHPVKEILLHSHPSIDRRIARAMAAVSAPSRS
jgi:STE24 endopeptidase